jgi:LDH2 family malate/lactate/ureidoglycolate dehydrogenase
MTNSPPGIAPTGGKKPYLGTNPIAFGFPTPSGPPLIVDMSSSMVARGKIILAAKQGEEIPSGWALDEEGIETTSPNAALKGSVLPLGGAKGYALATAIEMFSGVLSGAAFGTNVASIYDDQAGPANVGHHFILYHLEHWMPMKVYYERITRFLEELKAIPPANKGTEITYPGERRYRRYLERKAKEIPLSDVVIAELNQLAFECRLPQSL